MIFELLHEKEEEEQVNRFIHKAMGKEWFEIPHYWRYPDPNPNYLEHNSDWTKMVNWAKEESWWRDFQMIIAAESSCMSCIDDGVDVKYFADPTALATAITEYLEGRDGDTK